MKLKIDKYDQLAVFSMRGELTLDDIDQFRKVAVEQLDEKVRDFVLDCSETEFIDSQGLEALLWLQGEAMSQLGQVRLAACQETVRKILEITRLAGRFERHDTVEAAVKSLR